LHPEADNAKASSNGDAAPRVALSLQPINGIGALGADIPISGGNARFQIFKPIKAIALICP
jgi:hypothetical protein